MRIISLWDEKGGCGKSTLAWSLAGAATHQGLKVLLVDEDPQGTCVMLAQKTELIDFSIVSQWPDEKPNVDLVIVDMPPHTNTAPLGTVILPYQPTLISYSVASKHKKRLSESCDRVIEVITMIDTRKKNHRDFIQDSSALNMRYRSIYERVTNDATSLYTPKYKNLSGAREARNEITKLLKEALK